MYDLSSPHRPKSVSFSAGGDVDFGRNLNPKSVIGTCLSFVLYRRVDFVWFLVSNNELLRIKLIASKRCLVTNKRLQAVLKYYIQRPNDRFGPMQDDSP